MWPILAVMLMQKEQVASDKIIYAIPGLGSTGELYAHTRVKGYTLRVLEWPKPLAGWTMKEYAAAFIPQLPVSPSDPVNLIGVSFGGMVCAELASIVPVNKVVLLSSCQNELELPWTIKLFRYLPLHRITPDYIICRVGYLTRHMLGFPGSYAPHFRKMLRQMPKGYFYHCVNYIINWRRTEYRPEFIRIHGGRDKVLWRSSISKVDFEVAEGEHVMVFTRYTEVNKCLERIFNGDGVL